MDIRIWRVSPHFIWLMGLLEAVTVPLVVWLPTLETGGMGILLLGAIVGFAGVVVVVYALNTLTRWLSFRFAAGRIVRLSVFTSAFWGGITLTLLFAFQALFAPIIALPFPWRDIVLGFISTSLGVLCLGYLYRTVVRRANVLTVVIRTDNGRYALRSFSEATFAGLAGIYEAVAVPLINLWFQSDGDPVFMSAITGATGGLAGGLVIWLIARSVRAPFATIRVRPLQHPAIQA
jgi:hypothetical protein